MLDIEIKTIPHESHRYPTVGDYWDEGDKECIRVSEMGNWKWEFLVAIHELIEKALCKDAGTPEEAITAFDIEYEKNRPEGDESEPGDCPDAPYYLEHQMATGMERMLAALLGVDWNEYDNALAEL